MDAALLPYLKRWYLTAPELIASTPTSDVYKVLREKKKRVIKLYTTLGRIYEAPGAVFLEQCAGQGTVQVFSYDEGAALLDYIDGPELVSMVQAGKDDQATRTIIHILNQVHAAPMPRTINFTSLADHMRSLFSHAAGDTPAIIKRAAAFAPQILSTQEDPVMLHGDMHHRNVLQHSEHGWVAIDPQCLIGERAYDCANTLHNPLGMPELTENIDRLLSQARLMGMKMRIDPQRIIDYAYLHGCLSACWSKDDNGEYDEARLRTSAILEPHTSIGKQ